MKDKKKLTLTIVAVVAFIAVVVGATYAYFVANVGSGSGANINATTGTTDSLSFNTGSRINIYATTENFGQGLGNQADSTTASATLVANNGNNYAKYTYYMYLDISKNELKYTTLDKRAELILTITDKEGMPITSIEGLDYVTIGDVSGFDITESQGIITILNNHEIETTSTEVHEWNITVTLINLDSNQSENLNKTFLADVLIQKDEYVEEVAVLKRPQYIKDSTGDHYFWDWYLELGNASVTNLFFENVAVEHTDAEKVYDFSEAQDESIKAYLVKNESNDKYTLYINSDKKIVAPENSSYWFAAYGFDLEEIKGIELFDTRNVTDMHYMFGYYGGNYGGADVHSGILFSELDLSSWNTSKVTNMERMFYDCSGLTNLDLSSFDTSKVTSMYEMFYKCSGLTTLDLSSLDTSKVTTIQSMFFGCRGLTELDLSTLDTSNVTNMGSMFEGCSGLTTLDLSSFDTSNVIFMYSMFEGCSGLTSVDLSGLDTGNVTSMDSMFSGCSGLTSLDMRNANFTKVTRYSSMFSSVSSNINIIVKDAAAENFIKTKAGSWPSTGTVTIAS